MTDQPEQESGHVDDLSTSNRLAAFQAAVPSQVIDVGGQIWSVRDTDPGSARMPIVMLPGAGGTGDTFYHAIERVRPSRRVISVAYPPLESADELAKALGSALDKLGVGEIDILGSSVGGYVAQAFVHEWPERVRRCMLCNTFFDAAWLRAKISTEAIRETSPDNHLANTLKQLQGLPEGNPAEVDFKETMLALVGHEQTAAMARATLLAALSATRIGVIPLPSDSIVVLDCDDDKVVDEPTRQALRDRYRESDQHHLAGGGHYPALLNAIEFSRAVERHFVES